MKSPEEITTKSKVYFLKSVCIMNALVIHRKDHILISEDDGETWGMIPNNLVQGTVPITDWKRKK